MDDQKELAAANDGARGYSNCRHAGRIANSRGLALAAINGMGRRTGWCWAKGGWQKRFTAKIAKSARINWMECDERDGIG
jgi:hypothetical protein